MSPPRELRRHIAYYIVESDHHIPTGNSMPNFRINTLVFLISQYNTVEFVRRDSRRALPFGDSDSHICRYAERYRFCDYMQVEIPTLGPPPRVAFPYRARAAHRLSGVRRFFGDTPISRKSTIKLAAKPVGEWGRTKKVFTVCRIPRVPSERPRSTDEIAPSLGYRFARFQIL